MTTDLAEDVLNALAGLPPIGSVWARRQNRSGRLSSIRWQVTGHRDGVAIVEHVVCRHASSLFCAPTLMRPWGASTWERVT